MAVENVDSDVLRMGVAAYCLAPYYGRILGTLVP